MAPLTPLISTDWPGVMRPCQLKSLGRATGASAPIATRIRTMVRITRISFSSKIFVYSVDESNRYSAHIPTAVRPVIAVRVEDIGDPHIRVAMVPREDRGKNA